MWDTLHREETKKRAADHFAHLRDVVWKDQIKDGAQIFKFTNTHASALEIIGAATHSDTPMRRFELSINHPIAPLVYEELVNRIHIASQERQWLQAETIRLLTTPDAELESITISSLNNVDARLAAYINQLVAFRNPRPPARVYPLQIEHEPTLDLAFQLETLVHIIERVLTTSLQVSKSLNPQCIEALQRGLFAAQMDLRNTYIKIQKLSPPPPNSGVKPFVPSISPTTLDNVFISHNLPFFFSHPGTQLEARRPPTIDSKDALPATTTSVQDITGDFTPALTISDRDNMDAQLNDESLFNPLSAILDWGRSNIPIQGDVNQGPSLAAPSTEQSQLTIDAQVEATHKHVLRRVKVFGPRVVQRVFRMR
ncbi:hypothetical protein CVT24_010173 [Panaeolus cyanescens]|uniref:Uncharacterized protein n=1 Tax=Panaeolus cyanescens TaxID=181874 RepID=A0A409W9P8_9AGAR|nr:hypothetical protein CVT24_010173 [Panaeolus cyanescens]